MNIEVLEKIVNNLCLETLEMNGGHILSCHDTTDDVLIYRLKNENKYASSAWDIPRKRILTLIQKGILAYGEKVIKWMNATSYQGDIILKLNCKDVIGHGYTKAKWHNWEDGAWTTTSYIVVLRKVYTNSNYDTFTVASAYPFKPNPTI